MKKQLPGLLLWFARSLGILSVLFTSIFALDVFEQGFSFEALLGLLIHLAPVYVIIAALVIGWRRPRAGAIAFAVVGLLFSLFFGPLALPVFAPLFVIAALFLGAWLTRPTL